MTVVARRQRARPEIPETLGYRLKRTLLGPPLVTEQLSQERLRKPIALGVLSPDCISSTAYGTEEMLVDPRPLRRTGRVQPRPADHVRHPRRPHLGHAVLSRSGHGLHQGRRLVRGGPGQLRSPSRPDRSGGVAHRLHGHGGRANVRWHQCPDLSRAFPGPLPAATSPWRW